jgi:hypothetical protein
MDQMRVGGSDVYLRTGERRQSPESAGIEAATTSGEREGEKGERNRAAQGREREWIEGAVAPVGFDPHGILILFGLAQ